MSAAIQVTFAGVTAGATVTSQKKAPTVRDAFTLGSKKLGIPEADINEFDAIVNGQDADLDDVIKTEDIVSFAPAVANGK